VGAEHINSLQPLKKFSTSFYPTQDMGKFKSREQSPFQSSILWADKEQVEVPEVDDSQISNINL